MRQGGAWLLAQVVRTRSQELYPDGAGGGLCHCGWGFAVLFQASMALGAFLGGMVVGKTKIKAISGADVLPLRDAFAVLFFLSVGMLFDRPFCCANPGLF